MKILSKVVIIGVLASGSVQAVSTKEFTAAVMVKETLSCVLSVAPSGPQVWNLRWKKQDINSGKDPLSMANNNDTTEPEVVVKFTPESSPKCSLANMNIGVSESAGNDTQLGLIKNVNENYFWRYMPVITRLDLFTSATMNADNQIDLQTITIIDGANQQLHRRTDIESKGNKLFNSTQMNNLRCLNLENNYLTVDGFSPFTLHGNNTSFKLDKPLESNKYIKAAKIGVGAIIASNPESNNGQANTIELDDGTNVNLPFTIVVTNS